MYKKRSSSKNALQLDIKTNKERLQKVPEKEDLSEEEKEKRQQFGYK